MLTDLTNAAQASVMDEPAADHLATIDWQCGAWSDKKGKYSRQHLWALAGARPSHIEQNYMRPMASDCRP